MPNYFTYLDGTSWVFVAFQLKKFSIFLAQYHPFQENVLALFYLSDDKIWYLNFFLIFQNRMMDS